MNIDFYPYTEIAKFHPPKPVKHKLPDWFKQTPVIGEKYSSYDDFFNRMDSNNLSPFTIKKCIPVLDYLTSGYLLSYVSDAHIEITEHDGVIGYNWKTPSPEANVLLGHHHHAQCPVSLEGSKFHYIKMGLSWSVRTPPGYSCFFYQPHYDFNNNLKILPAIIDTDKHDSFISIPGYITAKKSFMINAGDPFVVVFPFKRDEWNMKIHDKLINFDDSNFAKILKFKFFEIYKDFFHSKKRFN